MHPRPMSIPDEIRTWEQISTCEELMALMARQDFRVLGRPGEIISYSNEGYVLLAAIVERASGRPFAEYLQAQILDPLGPLVGDIAAGHHKWTIDLPCDQQVQWCVRQHEADGIQTGCNTVG